MFDFARVPCADHVAATVGIVFERVNDCFDLIGTTAVTGAPIGPLCAVNATEVTVFVSPFVPDAHIVILQVFDISVTFQEPEQLMDDGAQVQLLGSEQWKIWLQREAGLRAEDRVSASAGAVVAISACFNNSA